MQSFYDLTYSELSDLVTQQGFSSGQCEEFYRTMYNRGTKALGENPQLGGEAFDYLMANLDFELPKIVKELKSLDQTVKFLVEFKDGQQVETVLVPFWKKYTICLSSQVGCSMKCSFCFTGKRGLKRNLSAGEIIGQYLLAWNWLKENKSHQMSPNIVFMGQGEPLHNFEQVKKAIELFLGVPGPGLGPKQITLSTVGFLPGLKKFTELPPINLALSLHGATQKMRSELIPVNEKYTLSEILKTLDELPLEGKKLVNYEYLLIGGVNDSVSDAHELAALLKERKAMVNLIPFNEFEGCDYKRPSVQAIDNFKKTLVGEKIRVMIRTTKGDDILAACGQLANALID